MDTDGRGNTNNFNYYCNNNNPRKYNRRGNSNPKSKKQLENELNRQRSFFVDSPHNRSSTVVQYCNNNNNIQADNLNGSSNGVVGQKKHPTLAIYRPPTNGLQKSKNFKDDLNTLEGCSKLNVNAKEFSLERSKTAPQSLMNGTKSEIINHSGGTTMQLSRSRTFYTNGEIKPNNSNQKKYVEFKEYKNNVQQTKNIQQKNVQGPKVQFKEPKRKPKPALSHDETNKYAHRVPVSKNDDFVLRKSKSFNGPETRYPQSTYEETSCSVPYKNLLNEFCIKNLNCFPEDINDMAKRIVQDTRNSPTKDLMLLALKIIEHAVSKQEAMNTSVGLSLYIIERDTRNTYVSMIINTIQLWFVKRDKLLQPPPRFCSYATFVLLMYIGMKQNKVLSSRMEKEAYSRKQTLLILLLKICEHCLTPSRDKDCTVEEIKCLFDIVTAVGRDLEQEVPDTLGQMYVSMRDAVLSRECPTFARKTLMHLIELKASKWVLSSSAINYYGSKTNV